MSSLTEHRSTPIATAAPAADGPLRARPLALSLSLFAGDKELLLSRP
ncbi:MAG: hypothetical protein IIC53_03340 [Proteobacteria bacterium]|nr:hypothetical protein [Pseudomonadota bacterium]